MFSRSLKLGKVAGVDLQLHWSLLLGCAFFYATMPVANALNLLATTVLLLSVVLSITAHEFGHALMARRFGFPTRQIVLWVLGGVAMMAGEPRRSRDKIAIYAAGPLVNLAIAGLLLSLNTALVAWLGVLWYRDAAIWLLRLGLPPLNLSGIGGTIAWFNMVLALVNLLPIYPLDGGRILLAALSPWLGERRANLAALLLGASAALGLLIYFGFNRNWAGAGEMLLLLLVVGTLNPWFNQQLSRASVWWLHRGTHYAFARLDYDRALAYADRQIARGRRLAEHSILRSYVLLKTGDLAAAWAAADQAARLPGATEAERAMALNNRGSLALLQGNLSAARADLDAAIQANPRLAYAYDTRGYLAGRLGDNAQALADLNTALELAPQFIEARYHRAELLFAGGDFDGARADAAFAFTAKYDALLDWSELELKHVFDGRLAWAQQAVAWADPSWPAARTQRFLGDALRVNGHAAEAVAAYSQALATLPADVPLLLRRASAYQACAMPGQARADIEHLLACRPKPWLRKQALTLQASLTAPTTGIADLYSQPSSLTEAEQV